MGQKKFLDFTGLSTYDQKIKEKIKVDNNTTLQEAKKYSDGLAKNYDAAGTAEQKVNALKSTEVAANTSAIAKLNGEEGVAGSVKKAVKDLENKLTPTIIAKADKSTTLAGYGISDAYTKGEADSAIASAIANAPHLKRKIVTELPEVGTADENTIYMVGTGAGSQTSNYDEFMVIEGAFEKIGSSAVNLSDYAKKTEVESAKQEAKSYSDGLAKNYATAAQGLKADSALQKTEITTGTSNGSISVKGTDVTVKGLGSAAFSESNAFEKAGAVNALEKGQVTLNKNSISAIEGRLGKLEGETYTSITKEEIDGLFTAPQI